MNPLNEIVAQAMTSITGMAVDITTVAVGTIVIFVLILGADLLRVTILGGASGSSKNREDKPDFAKDNEEKYNKYVSNRYWKEQYKDRYENDFK